jgi:hypothetical protein
MKKIKFDKKHFRKLLRNGDIKILLDRVEERAEAEARLKEIEAIYPSLVGIAEDQWEININVPNGTWTFLAKKN